MPWPIYWGWYVETGHDKLIHLNPNIYYVPIEAFNALVDVVNAMNDMIDALAEELWGADIHDR